MKFPSDSSTWYLYCLSGHLAILWPEIHNGLGTSDLVEDVLLLLEGVGLCEVDLNLAQHFHRPVAEPDVDLSARIVI